MLFRMLGPLRMWDGTAWTDIRAPQQRVVLAALLLNAGRPVSADRLIAEVWGDRPPRTALNTVQKYVSQLRRCLVHSELVTQSHGYQLKVDADRLDAHRFERLADMGKRSAAEERWETAIHQLSEATALWQGPALSDVPDTPTVRLERSRLEQVRLSALEARLGTQLRIGRHEQVVDELVQLVEENPLRERLRAHLMLSLYRCGRRADALETYRRGRRALIDELGLEPGPELRHLEQAILQGADELTAPDRAGTPPTRPVPAQLPAAVTAFTGRSAQLRRLDGCLPPRDGTHDALLVISTIAGMAGVGKSALAIHWAHRVRGRFPDGQLYVDLRGHAATPPLTPIEALNGFLRALGVPGDEIPGDVDGAAALYRSLLASKRLLVILDNATDPDQVRPLVPGNPACVTLVTGRDRMDGLVARDGATRVSLDVLDVAEATALLTRLLGPDRSAEADELPALAELCGNLPLALRIAAADVAAHPAWKVTEYSDRLRGDQLGTLEATGDPQTAVRSAIDLSYAALPAEVRRLFRLLGLVPGLDVTEHAAAALANTDPARAARLVDRLAAAHLIEEHSAGRYSFHDLPRLFAAERARAEETASERQAAIERLLDHYLHVVDGAARRLWDGRLRIDLAAWPKVDRDRSADVVVHDDASARSWLDAERSNLVATVRQAAEHGPRTAAWLLSDALRGYFSLCLDIRGWHEVARLGLAAAEADCHLQAQTAAHLSLAELYARQSRWQPAIEHHQRAGWLARRAGWVDGEAAAVGNLGAVCLDMGRLTEAADHLDRALTINARTGWGPGRPNGLGNLAAVYHALGRLDDALAALTEARELYQKSANRYGEGDSVRTMAAVHRDAGRHADALELALLAVGLARASGDRQGEVDARNTLASVRLSLGETRQAVDECRRALELARSIDACRAEAEALTGLALAERLAGQAAYAADHARAALAVARQAASPVTEGRALVALAAIQLDLGRAPAAVASAQQALAIHRETEHTLDRARAHLVMQHALVRAHREADAGEHRREVSARFADAGVDADEQGRILLGPAGPAGPAR